MRSSKRPAKVFALLNVRSTAFRRKYGLSRLKPVLQTSQLGCADKVAIQLFNGGDGCRRRTFHELTLSRQRHFE